MNNKQKIYKYIDEKLDKFVDVDCIQKSLTDAYEIERELGIVRNNASSLLNELVKEKKLIKIFGRPVRFITVSFLCQFTEDEIKESMITLENLTAIMEGGKVDITDPFFNMVGNHGSLKIQVDQGKSAISYPPNGLHTLIIGESGTGKTLFASLLHQYGMNLRGKSTVDYPFVVLNCANYYSNPQLLLSNLFGHKKGSFTGADSDRVGLVEKADKGILFLDEVHRLPPEGQEMLFHLIDTGEYSRLGESDKRRKANVLIIAATTEDPHEVLLKTFLRRIPVIITLPPLREKPIRERLDIIRHFFGNEAKNTQNSYLVGAEVIKAMSLYECPRNVGELISEIKLLCAKAFFKNSREGNMLKIDFDMLPQKIKDPLFNISNLEPQDREQLQFISGNLCIEQDGSTYFVDEQGVDSSIYNAMVERIDQMQQLSLSEMEMDENVSEELQNYYRKILLRIDKNELNLDELYHAIDKEIVDFSVDLLDYAAQQLGTKYDETSVFSLSFHIKSLLDRIKENKTLLQVNLSSVKNLYKKEYIVAKKLVERINQKYDINRSDVEVSFITIIISNTKTEQQEELHSIGLVIAAHGESTASSMAQVCNRLTNTSLLKSIDMPLDKPVEDAYQETLTLVKEMRCTDGVILMTDMGSLTGFGDRIRRETGINIKTISNISTPLVLEILNHVLYSNGNIEDIYHKVSPEKVIAEINSKKQKAVLAVCTTGKGTAEVLKKLIQQEIEEHELDIEVVVMDYVNAANKTLEFKNIQKKYALIACVGNVNPHINIPFYRIEQLLIGDGKKRFLEVLEKSISFKAETEDEGDVFALSQNILNRYIVFINPNIAVMRIKSFLADINSQEERIEPSISLIIHMVCMIERLVCGELIKYKDKDAYIQENKELHRLLKGRLIDLEDTFKVKVTDDELCYLIQVIKN